MPEKLNNYHCFLCNYTGEPKLQYDLGKHKIFCCKKCKLKYLLPQPSSIDICKLYDSEDYFLNTGFYSENDNYLFGYHDYYAERYNKQKNYLNLIKKCKTYLSAIHNNKNYDLLEIGCGPGFFLEIAQQENFNIHGIEFNKTLTDKLNTQFSNQISYANIEKYSDFHESSQDCVVMLDVIEHLYKPQIVIEKIFKILKPGGILLLSTMNSDSIISKLLGKKLEDFRRFKEHLFFFNKTNIQKLLRNEGFKILQIKSNGHTFQLNHLFLRIFNMIFRNFSKKQNIFNFLKCIPSYNIHFNPGTKFVLFALKPDIKHYSVSSTNVEKDLEIMQSESNYYKSCLNLIKSHLKNKNIIDLGCGSGNITAILKDFGANKILGIDKNQDLINKAKQNIKNSKMPSNDIQYISMDIENNTSELCKIITDFNADIIFSFNFFEHIKNDIKLINEIYCHLNFGIKLITFVPSNSDLYNQMDEEYNHFRRYDIYDLSSRFSPFKLHKFYKCHLIKALGWKFFGNKGRYKFNKNFILYQKFIIFDTLIDKLFKYNVPYGSQLISIHEK